MTGYRARDDTNGTHARIGGIAVMCAPDRGGTRAAHKSRYFARDGGNDRASFGRFRGEMIGLALRGGDVPSQSSKASVDAPITRVARPLHPPEAVAVRSDLPR